MSEVSYQAKVRMGLTGPDACLPVCYPTAFDRISGLDIRTETYIAYIGACAVEESCASKRNKNRVMSVALNMIATDMGLDSWRDLGFANESRVGSFCRMLRHMVKRGCGVVLDMDATEEHDLDYTAIYKPQNDPHGIGLIALNDAGDMFNLTSSWLPMHMQGPHTPEDIFDYLIHQSCNSWQRFPFHDANVTYFPLVCPPAKKGGLRTMSTLPK